MVKNWISDRGDAPFYAGILVRDGVTDSAIMKKVVRGASDFGISLGDGDSNRLVKNYVRHCGAFGLDLGGDSKKVLKNNLKNSGQTGMVIQGSENIIEKNFVEVSGHNGIVILEDSNTVEKNIVRESGEYVIFLGPESQNNTLEKNIIKDSGEFDLKDEGDNSSFEKNKCDTSEPDGLYN